MPFLKKCGGIRREDGGWLLDAGLAIHKVEEMLGVQNMSEKGNSKTLAEFIFHHLGRIAHEGDEIHWHNWRFDVIKMDKNQIGKVVAMPTRNLI